MWSLLARMVSSGTKYVVLLDPVALVVVVVVVKDSSGE